MFARYFTFIAIGCALAGAADAAERAGLVTASQPQAYQAEGSVGFEVFPGTEIFRNARLYTKQYGTIDVRLDDGTNLTVAPRSSLLIDDFVFAGERRPGSLALSLTRGAVRMASGRMPKHAVGVETPVAHIGVRGTEFWVNTVNENLIEIWVTEGAVIATPVQSEETFEFTAKTYATCTATACKTNVIRSFPDREGGGGQSVRRDKDLDPGEDAGRPGNRSARA